MKKKLAELENRNDGDVQIIDVKLNNRKTKTTSKVDDSNDVKNQLNKNTIPNISSLINEKIASTENSESLKQMNSNSVNVKNTNKKK